MTRADRGSRTFSHLEEGDYAPPFLTPITDDPLALCFLTSKYTAHKLDSIGPSER
jgi:hypothetical protein